MNMISKDIKLLLYGGRPMFSCQVADVVSNMLYSDCERCSIDNKEQ